MKHRNETKQMDTKKNRSEVNETNRNGRDRNVTKQIEIKRNNGSLYVTQMKYNSI